MKYVTLKSAIVHTHLGYDHARGQTVHLGEATTLYTISHSDRAHYAHNDLSGTATELGSITRVGYYIPVSDF